MNKYLPLYLNHLKTWKNQFGAVFYRIYINIFGIFLRIRLLPLSIDKTAVRFWYKGDEIWWLFKKIRNKRWCSLGFSGDFSFGEAMYDSLKEMDEDWNKYFEACGKIDDNIGVEI